MTLEKKVLIKRPHCFHDGEAHYKAYDKQSNETFCAMSDDSCPYYKAVKTKDYCKYIGNYKE